MELTIEQALRQGDTAQKEGKLEEAKPLYHAILQSQPAHPDANHNLGVIEVSVNNTEAVRSNEKNMNHSLMEHLMVCYCHELGASVKLNNN